MKLRWQTRDGRKMKIKKMSNQHLMNTISMLHGKKVFLRNSRAATTVINMYLEAMEAELEKRAKRGLIDD